MSKSKSKKMCCQCINWEVGDTWQTNQNSNAGQPVVISDGWCCSPKRKRPKPKWSHCPVCPDFDEAPRTGFIICGQGAPTHEVMEEIIQKTNELLKD